MDRQLLRVDDASGVLEGAGWSSAAPRTRSALEPLPLGICARPGRCDYNREMAARAIGLMVPVGTYGDLPVIRRLADLAEDLQLGAFLLEEGPGSELDPVVTLGHLARSHPSPVLGMVLRDDNGRPPSVLAKLVSGLDLVSGGRTTVALGDLDRATPPGARQLEAFGLISNMLTRDLTTFSGRSFSVPEAWNRPRMTRDLDPWPKLSLALSARGLVSMNGWFSQAVRTFFVGVDDQREVPASLSAAESTAVGVDSSPTTVMVLDADRDGNLAAGTVLEARSDAIVYRWREFPEPEHVRALIEARSTRP